MSPPAPVLDPCDERETPSRRVVALAAVCLVLAALAAYARSFSGPFVYDDLTSIPDNLSLRHLWPLSGPLSPPHGGFTVDGRPILNLSFALNYAWGGASVAGYHAVNLLIHVLAGLTLFGLARRTLVRPVLAGRFGGDSLPIAFTLAALWTLHPLQTESVDYVVQRAESLMGLFYLLTLYAFVRGTERAAAGASPLPWYGAACGACLLGMGTKEVMVTAPVLVLCYDRAFVAGTFREAWRRRSGIHLALMATWIPLAFLVAGTGGDRGGTSGFDVGVAWWAYDLTQFQAVVRYLALSIWPRPLIFEYGFFWARTPGEILPYAAIVVPLGAASLWALVRRPALGFLGFWFFGILAPTSLVPGPLQMIAEHRMYLPLAAVLALVAAGTHRLAGRRGLAALLAVAVGFGCLTARRQRDYRSELALWGDAVAKRPASLTARESFGAALAAAGRQAEAVAEFRTVLRAQPKDAQTQTDLGDVLAEMGRMDEAMPHLDEALRLKPNYAEAHVNLGAALDQLGRTQEAIAQYQEALRLKPGLGDAHNDLSDAWRRLGRTAEAIREAETAVALKPDFANARYNLANALAEAGRLPEARAQFAAGERIKPPSADALHGWGNALVHAGEVAEALAVYLNAIGLKPGDPVLRYDYGTALAASSRYEPAAGEFREALRLRPAYPEAHNNLGNALSQLHRDEEAALQYEEALRLKPDNPRALNNLGLSLARLGRLQAAAVEFAAAVGLAPDFQEARENLRRAQLQLDAGASPN
jgi:protein O-mannosyl-transferase